MPLTFVFVFLNRYAASAPEISGPFRKYDRFGPGVAEYLLLWSRRMSPKPFVVLNQIAPANVGDIAMDPRETCCRRAPGV
jgi:hypothetical protein